MSVDSYKFLPDFEMSLLSCVFGGGQHAEKIVRIWAADKFDSDEAKASTLIVSQYYTKRGKLPTATEVCQILQEQCTAGAVTQPVADENIHWARSACGVPPIDGEYLLERITEAERHTAVLSVIANAVKRHLPSKDYQALLLELGEAVNIGTVEAHSGIDFGWDILRRHADRKSGKTVHRYSTGYPALDSIIKGGLAAGELGVVLAGPKMGKSQFLMMVALAGMKVGLHVLYYSLEMSEQSLLDRADAALCERDIDDLAMFADEVLENTTDFAAEHGGSLRIKQYAPGSVSCRDLDSDIAQYRRDTSMTPGLIVIDYGDLLKSARPQERRHEELGLVYTEMRALAITLQVPVWTASQSTREALEKAIPTMGDVAESFKKVQVCDLMVAICGSEDERNNHVARLYTAACRFSSPGQLVGPFRTRFEQGRFVDIGVDV